MDHFQKYFFPIYDKNSFHILLFCRLYKSNNVATDTFEVRYQMRMHLVKVILFHQIVRRHLYFQLNAQLSSLPDFLDCEHFFFYLHFIKWWVFIRSTLNPFLIFFYEFRYDGLKNWHIFLYFLFNDRATILLESSLSFSYFFKFLCDFFFSVISSYINFSILIV